MTRWQLAWLLVGVCVASRLGTAGLVYLAMLVIG
jgi:hypothetical protein